MHGSPGRPRRGSDVPMSWKIRQVPLWRSLSGCRVETRLDPRPDESGRCRHECLRHILALVVTAAAAFGGASAIRVNPGAGSVLEVKGKQKRAVLNFDLAAVPAATTVVSARLALTIDAVSSEPPINPKRFAVSAGDAHVANLVVKGPGTYTLDLTKYARRVSPLVIRDSGLDANPSATLL